MSEKEAGLMAWCFVILFLTFIWSGEPDVWDAAQDGLIERFGGEHED